MFPTPGSYLDQLLEAEEAAWQAERAARRPSRAAKKNFRSSLAWRRVRYSALRANLEKHGKLTCEVCGAMEGPWHADHIVPVSKDWSRRLDITNIQVTCEACNLGKGNTDSIDWREPSEVPAHRE